MIEELKRIIDRAVQHDLTIAEAATEILYMMPVSDAKTVQDVSPGHYRGNLPTEDVWGAEELLWGQEMFRAHLQMAAFEYRMRAGYKGAFEADIKKALACEKKAKNIQKNNHE